MLCSLSQENKTLTKLQPRIDAYYKNLIEAYKLALEPSYLYVERQNHLSSHWRRVFDLSRLTIISTSGKSGSTIRIFLSQ